MTGQTQLPGNWFNRDFSSLANVLEDDSLCFAELRLDGESTLRLDKAYVPSESDRSFYTAGPALRAYRVLMHGMLSRVY